MTEVMRLHWFGQTLGPGRGIEEAIEAVGLLGQGVELHLRGRVPESYRSTIDELARRYGAGKNIVLHPTVGPDDLIRTMNQFDVGLALERPEHPNYSLAATNKIMSYLLAGLAVAATDTLGHREVLERFPSTEFLYPATNARALAEGLRRWLTNRDMLRDAQQAAWNAARQRFCWDIEKEKLFQVIEAHPGKSFTQAAY